MTLHPERRVLRAVAWHGAWRVLQSAMSHRVIRRDKLQRGPQLDMFFDHVDNSVCNPRRVMPQHYV